MTGDDREFSMADVAGKPVTRRLALASGRITVGAEAFELLKNKALPKGDALALAEFAGIQAAKQTPSLKLTPKPAWKWKPFARSISRC